MGRKKGSKNKPKLTPMEKPFAVWLEPAEEKAWAHLKDLPDIGTDLVKVPANVSPVKKVPKPVRDLEEKVEFLLEDMKSLRTYMCRFEDAFAAARIALPEKPVLVTPTKYKSKRKP
jgi:hypothetical protein